LITFVIVAAMTAAGDTPPAAIPATSTGNNGAAPIGIEATTSELLFSQPFCAGQQSRGIYKLNIAAGTSTLVSTIPEVGACSESDLTISPGLGGFTAGDTFVTGVSTTNSNNEEVFRNGSTKFIDGIPSSAHHAGLTFDTAGTFGFDLIVAAEGSVTGYDSTGAAKFTYAAPANYVLEGATVVPLTDAACPGCLYITAELTSNVGNPHPSGPGAIFLVTPGTPSGSTITLWSLTPGSEPEGLVFVGHNLSCSLLGASGASYSYFVSGYATGSQIDTSNATNGAILAYTPAQLAPYAGQFLVPDEGSLNGPGIVHAFSGPGASTVFSTTGYQLEGSTILQCPSSGCPATFGFWKNHPLPSSMFVGGNTSIGCHSYSAADLVAILDQNAGGGNAVIILAHQLIAAIANYDAGAQQTSAATAAIGSAVALLCANSINMSTSVVQASTALGQQMTALADVLDKYNSATGLNCQEGAGLTTGN
jgi:hypothetical protein